MSKMKRIAFEAVEGPVTSTIDCQLLAQGGRSRDEDMQVFVPPIVSYFPFPSYPLEMIGGMLQQAAL
jgi:hypothetical protein